MAYFSYQPQTPRLPVIVLVLLAGLYLLAGVTEHDPWKAEDAIHIGIAHGFLAQGQWLFPHIAGAPWPHTAPLYHWVAAGLGHLLGDLLPFHNAARLASTLFGAIFLLAIAGAARTAYGKDAGRSAPLLAIGTLGLLITLHEAQPATAGLAFAAIAWWGGGLILQGKRHGAILLGAGLGLAFLSHGLVGLLMAIAVLPAPILRGDWKGLFITLAIAIALGAAWPLLLANNSPGLWLAWWRNEMAEATLARGTPEWRHLEQLIWAAWPILPLAIWSLWLHRHSPAQLMLPALGSLLGLAWYLTGSSRTLGMLPALIPFTLLAAASVDKLRRGAANAFAWFGVMTFSFIAFLIWLGASAQALGWPPTIARNFSKLAPGHQLEYPLAALAFAILITVAWIVSWRLPRATWRPTLFWASGTTMMWVLVTTLLLPWIDHYKSYRPVVASLRAALPTDIDCLQRDGLGTSYLAMLDYYAGIRTVSPASGRSCNWRLVADDKDRVTPAGWTLHWQGRRPSDRNDAWFLEQRNN